ncbi:MAG: nitric-oxide reductase, partial [Planctomycetota bacterium]
MNLIKWIDKRKHWWKVFVLIFAVSVTVVGYIGVKTYEYAPPIADFKDPKGRLVFNARSITDGQQVFFRYGLMDYGSFLGDGGLRGPDFTAEALNLTARWVGEHHDRAWRDRMADGGLRRSFVRALVQQELKENRYDRATNTVTLSAAQAEAFERLVRYYGEKFGKGGELAGAEAFEPANYISDEKEVRDLSAFFFWGGWLCAAKREGFGYSYTHNWPYDPLAGNTPAGGIVLWSVIGVLSLILSLGVVFYYYGKLDREAVLEAQKAQTPPIATAEAVDRFRPTPTQRGLPGQTPDDHRS